jgi:aryl-alcohol dehydrogenase-like predicted oxidoreductase
MHYRILGRTGVNIAPLALGTDNIGNPTSETEASKMILRALDAGINLIDTSNSYKQGAAEQVIGKTLKKSGRRDEAIIATKAYYPTGPGPNDKGNSRLHLIQACEDSLKRLQLDYIDLYQLHRPDFQVPIEETLSALTDLVRWGMVRYVGSSTAPAWKVMEATLTSELKGYVRFVSEQPPYNLLDRRIENELIPMAQAHNLAILPWSPLAMGILAGRYAHSRRPKGSRAALRGGIYAERVSAKAVEVGNRFVQLAHEAGYDPVHLAITWVKDQPGITAPIIGPKTVEQLDHLLPVLDMRLESDIAKACDELVAPGSVVANFHNSAPWMKMKLE